MPSHMTRLVQLQLNPAVRHAIRATASASGKRAAAITMSSRAAAWIAAAVAMTHGGYSESFHRSSGAQESVQSGMVMELLFLAPLRGRAARGLPTVILSLRSG